MKIKEQNEQRMVISGIFDKVVIDKTTKIITARKMHSFFRKRTISFSDVLHVRASSNTKTVDRFFPIGRHYGPADPLWTKEVTYWETILELPGHKTVIINGTSQQYPERFVIDESTKKEAMVYLADEINKYLGRG
ncbi:hypothetical protein ES703_33206 [subsurface metagenome]